MQKIQGDKIYHAYNNHNKNNVATLVSVKVGFKAMAVTRNKEAQLIIQCAREIT